jgi:hypothetical protein
MPTDDLWPTDLTDNIPSTPYSVLAEQAEKLGPKTNGLVKAEATVETGRTGNFVARFTIMAPTLGRYEYEVFSVRYEASLYPVFDESGILVAKNEEAFIAYVRDRLADPQTVSVVKALVGQLRTDRPFGGDDISF